MTQELYYSPSYEELFNHSQGEIIKYFADSSKENYFTVNTDSKE